MDSQHQNSKNVYRAKENHSKKPVHNTQSDQLRRHKRAALRRRRGLLIAFAALLILAVAGLVVWLLKGGRENPAPGAGSDVSESALAPAGGESESISQSASSSGQGSAVDASQWNLILANPDHPLPSDFSVQTATLSNGKEFDTRAIEALNQMLQDGNAAGLQLMVCSAYRSTAYQQKLFDAKKAEFVAAGYSEQEAYDKAATIVAVPGTSEHATGLAADIVAVNYQTLDDGFEDTPEFAWLSKHAAEYGFILRYPKDKQEITKIIYEPWHYRYVGSAAAKEISEKGLCLEEYLGQA